MPFISAPDTVQVVLHWTSQGQEFLNVLHFDTGGNAVTEAMADNIQLGVVQAATDDPSSWFLTHLAAQTQLDKITVRDLEVEGAMPMVREINVNGQAAGEPMPLMTALVTTLRTNFASRSGRGRIYHGGFFGGGLDPTDFNFATQAMADSANGWVTELRDELHQNVGAFFDLSVLSRFHDKVELDPYVLRPVVSTETGRRLDTQRRRRPPNVL